MIAGVVAAVYVTGGLVVALRMLLDGSSVAESVGVVGELPREYLITAGFVQVLGYAAVVGLVAGLVVAYDLSPDTDASSKYGSTTVRDWTVSRGPKSPSLVDLVSARRRGEHEAGGAMACGDVWGTPVCAPHSPSPPQVMPARADTGRVRAIFREATWSYSGRLLLACVLGLAGVALLVAGASSASAAGVSMQADVLAVTAGAGERNNIVIGVAGSIATVSDTGVLPVARAGCALAAPDRVTCQLGAYTRLLVALGGQDDAVVNNSALASVMRGGDGDDSLVGGAARDELNGGAGFDSIEARGGDDFISTRGTFLDRVSCGEGNDFVYADETDLVATDCEDSARPNDAGESVIAGSPPAVVVPEFTPQACTVLWRGNGDATATATADGDVMRGSNSNDRLLGGAGDDCLFGEDGNDELYGQEGKDFLSGGPVRDLLVGGPEADRLGGDAGADRLDGGDGADQAAGNSGRDNIKGRADDDRIHGGSGRDILHGGAGNDALEGGKHGDRIRAGKGSNRLSGGPGADLLIARNRQRDRITCGQGYDTVRADREDHIAPSCERVRRR